MNAAWWVLAAIDVAIVIWLYRSVKREDDAIEAEEPQQAELTKEMESFNRSHTSTEDTDCIPFALDEAAQPKGSTDHLWYSELPPRSKHMKANSGPTP